MAEFTSRDYQPPPCYSSAVAPQPASQVVPHSLPSYTAAGDVGRGGAGGRTGAAAGEARPAQPGRRRLEKFDVTKFIMLWSGAGRCICEH